MIEHGPAQPLPTLIATSTTDGAATFNMTQYAALVTAGVPHLNQPELVDLVWLLHQRYGPLARPAQHGAETTTR